MMNLEKEYEKALSMWEHKDTFGPAFYVFQKVAAELEDRSTLTQSEQKMLIDCYAKMYLIPWSGRIKEEYEEYVDRMIEQMTSYVEKYPEDVMVCDGCFFVMQAAYYYEEMYNWAIKLYKQSGTARELGLKWLTSLIFLWDGILTQEEYDMYNQEYDQLVSEAKQSSPEQEE